MAISPPMYPPPQMIILTTIPFGNTTLEEKKRDCLKIQE